MNFTENNSQDNQNGSTGDIDLSLQLALLSSIINTIGDLIGTIAAVTAIEEAKATNRQEQQKQMELDAKFTEMQKQIDMLKEEINNKNH